jgi:hypothetical protein
VDLSRRGRRDARLSFISVPLGQSPSEQIRDYLGRITNAPQVGHRSGNVSRSVEIADGKIINRNTTGAREFYRRGGTVNGEVLVGARGVRSSIVSHVTRNLFGMFRVIEPWSRTRFYFRTNFSSTF